MFSTGQVIPVKKDLCSQTFTTTYHMICIYQVIPGASQKNPDLVTNSGPLLALRSGSGPSPEFRTLLVPLNIIIFAGEQFDLNLVLADPPPLVHCYKMGPLLGNWVPMGTFLGNWVPFLCLGSPFSILDRRM